MAWKRAWAGRTMPLVVMALLLRLLLPHGVTTAAAAPALDGHAGHAVGHDAPRGAEGHDSGAQSCHFCRLDAPLFPFPVAPALGPKLRPAPAARPAAEPPPRRRDFSIRLRARAPPPSA